MPSEQRDLLTATTLSGEQQMTWAPSQDGRTGCLSARDFGALARRMYAETEPEAVRKAVLDVCVSALPAASAAGIATSRQGRLQSAHTCRQVAELHEMQSRAKDGPCFGPFGETRMVRSDDLATESRWPMFALGAVQRGYRSLMSFQLRVDDVDLGVLSILGSDAHAFDSDTESIGSLLAANAAVAMNARRLETNLRIALESRDVIGQAKGILMERFKLSPDNAFHVLVAVSQHQHRKVREIADELAATGDLPDLP